MNKQEAERWANVVIKDGTFLARKEYLDNHQIGTVAAGVWNDPLFTYGIEYGILIAIEKIFGDIMGGED